MAGAQVRHYLSSSDRMVTIPVEGQEPVEVTYRPSRRTPEFSGRYNEILNQGDLHKLWVFTICTLVTGWNLTGPLEVEVPKLNGKGKAIVDDYGVAEFTTKTIVKDGETVPVTSDVLRHFETAQLTEIVRAIFEDSAPDPKSGT